MAEYTEQLKKRSKAFSVNVLRLVDRLPSRAGHRVLGYQMAKSATSMTANYRAS